MSGLCANSRDRKLNDFPTLELPLDFQAAPDERFGVACLGRIQTKHSLERFALESP